MKSVRIGGFVYNEKAKFPFFFTAKGFVKWEESLSNFPPKPPPIFVRLVVSKYWSMES